MKVQQLTTLFNIRRRRAAAPPVRPRPRAVRLLMLGALVVVLAGVWAVASLVLYFVTPYGALYPQPLVSRLSANYQPWDAASQPLLAPLNPNVAQANDRDSQPAPSGSADGSDVLPAAVLPEAPRPVNVYGGNDHSLAAISPTPTSSPTPTAGVVVAAATGTATPTATNVPPTATPQVVGAATSAPTASTRPATPTPQVTSSTLPTAEAPKVPGTTPPAATSTDAPTSTPVTPTSTPVTPTSTPVTPTSTPVTPTSTPTPVTVTPVTVTPVTVTPVTVTPVTVTPVTVTPVTPTSTPTVQFSAATYSVGEARGSATITVTLSTAAAQAVTVSYATSDDTAKAGSDYSATSGTLSFGAGETVKTFAVPITNDTTAEPNETLKLTLSSPTNAALGTPSSATLTVNDDDKPTVQFRAPFTSFTNDRVPESTSTVTLTVQLNLAQSQPVTVDYAVSGTATSGSDYTLPNGTLTFAAGETSKVLTIQIVPDTNDEGDETISVTLLNPSANALLGGNATATVTIVDDDLTTVQFSQSSYLIGEGGNAEITVSLKAPATQAVTINYATSNATAVAGSDYTATNGTLTFAPGVTSQTFTVQTNGDTLNEGTETLSLTLTNPTNATLGTPSTATLTITDGPTVQFENASYSVLESGGQATVNVTLSSPSALPITVNYATSDGTAVQAGDYTATSGTLTFAPGVTSQSFTVPIVNDTLNEADETVALTLSNPTNAWVGTPSPAVLTITDDDVQPTVSFGADVSVPESVGTTAIVATLSVISGQDVTVPFTVSGTATGGGIDHTLAAGTIIIPAGSLSASLSFNVNDDNLDEPDETIIATMGMPTRANLGAKTTQTITLLNNDAPTVQFSSATYSVNENDATGKAIITVNLNSPSFQTVTVDYATSNAASGSNIALAGSDYTATSGTLTFTPGVTSQTFSVPITSDGVDEPDEIFDVVLSSANNALLGSPNPATVTIVNAPRVQFSLGSYTIGENGGAASITVVLSQASTQNVTVNYTTSNGTATAGSDYTATSGALTFAPGVTSQTFSVPITSDGVDEPDEIFDVALSSAGNALLGSPNPATVTIVNAPRVQFSLGSYTIGENGGAASIAVVLSQASTQNVTVNYTTSNGTATAGSDYTATSGALTFAPGVTSQTFSVPITSDGVDEPDEIFDVALSSANNALLGSPNPATVTIVNAPRVQFSLGSYTIGENGGAASIAVVLSQASTQNVTVNYTTSNGTATAGSDYTATSGTLTFTPGVTSQTFSVPITSDGVDEPDEIFDVVLSSANNALLGSPNPATVTIVNAPRVQFSLGSYTIGENGGAASITVVLSQASTQNVTVNYTTSNGTATAGSDYTATSGTLTFAPGVTSQTFNVSILDDNTGEPDETINLTLSAPTNATLGTSTAVLTILDDEPRVQFSAPTYQVNENGGTATITVQLLNRNPSSSVTVKYDDTIGGTAIPSVDYTSQAGNLVMSAVGNYTISIPINDNSAGEVNKTINLLLSAVTVPGDVWIDTSSSTLTIGDDEPHVQFNAATYVVNELDGTATVGISLKQSYNADITVNYAVVGGSATSGSDYILSSGTLTIVTPGTVGTFTIPIINTDATCEPDEDIMIQITSATGGSVYLDGPNITDVVIKDGCAAFSAANYNASIASGTATVVVTLNTALSTSASVNYTTVNGTATAGVDYTTTSGTLTFAPGQTSRTITVPVLAGATAGNQFTVNLTTPTNTSLATPATATLTITP